MDREIDHQQRRIQRRVMLLKWSLGAGGLLAAVMVLRAAITPSLDPAELRLATVQQGEMIAAIDVAGVIVPRSETIVSAPFAAELLEVLRYPGTAVQPGDSILRVDHRALDVAINELSEQLALTENQRRSRGLALDQALSESEGRRALLEIDLESRKARLARLQQLSEIGAISKGDLQEARLDVRRTEVELEQLERQIANQRESHAAELERIDLEAAILRNQLEERQRLRELATVRAPHAGVVTWVREDTGASVALGASLARVADLSTWRVEASVSDFYAQQLREGQAARIEAAGQVLGGRVSAVLPTVESGTVRLLLDLDQPDAEGLRPQLRADVQLVTDHATETLYVKRGPGAQGRGRTVLYQLSNGRAVRTPVLLGFSNRHQVQILEGLSAGDQVIVSDTSDFNHLQAIDIDSE